MSGTLVRSAVAGAVCALALGGCDARSDGDGATPGDAGASGEADASGGDVTFSGGGDRVTFGSGGDAVTFSAAPEGAVTFSSGGDVTFSSGGGASFSSGAPAPSAPAAPTGTVPGDAGDPAAVDSIGAPDPSVGTSGSVDPADPADLPTATAPPAASGPPGTATRGADPRFDFWDGDAVGAPLTSDDYLFRIARYGQEIWLEWFADESREDGSGENCWSPYLTAARLDREGELFVRDMGDGGTTRVEYAYDAGAGTLIEEMYFQDQLEYSERYRPVLAGTSFDDFPVCDET